MYDLNKVMHKLQIALKQKGIIVCINTIQFYSPENDRIVKMYKLTKGKEILVQTTQQIKVVELLKNMWREVKNND